MQQKIVACACIHQTFNGVNKILVTKRSSTADFLPGIYEIPGGHVEPGEELIAGLKREIKEELNIEITVGDLISAFTFIHKDSHTIEVVYLASSDNTNNIELQVEEIDSYVWITENDIKSLIEPNKPPSDHEIPILYKAFSHLTKSKI